MFITLFSNAFQLNPLYGAEQKRSVMKSIRCMGKWLWPILIPCSSFPFNTGCKNDEVQSGEPWLGSGFESEALGYLCGNAYSSNGVEPLGHLSHSCASWDLRRGKLQPSKAQSRILKEIRHCILVPSALTFGALSSHKNKIDYNSRFPQRVTWGAFCEQFNAVIECLLLETITHFLYTPLVSCK